jgi:hypothetical protein
MLKTREYGNVDRAYIQYVYSPPLYIFMYKPMVKSNQTIAQSSNEDDKIDENSLKNR